VFYQKHKTDEEIEQEMKQEKEHLGGWEKDKKDLGRMYKAGKPLEKIYDWEGNWEQLYYKVSENVPEDAMDSDEEWTKQLREFLNKKASWSDDQIWEAHIELCDEKIDEHKKEIADLEKQKQQNKLKLQVIKKLGNIPSKNELDRLLRYEGAIERQLYKALNQLERIQRLRAGDNVPAPVEVNLDVNTGQNT